jgi:ABC-type iron transport system FetAB ATPase subunit
LLLGSCINGVSLALDSINTALVEEMGEVQMLLVFGASKDESSQHLITSCLQKGLSSVRGMLRSMGTSGIVPMLMCGQILSGTPAKQATLHQITIAILVCLSTFSSVYLSSLAAVNSAFDSAQMFQVDHFIRNRNRSFVGLLWVLGSFFGRVEVLSNSAVSRRISESHEFYIGKSITSTFEANGDPNCSSSVVLEVSDLFLDETLSPNESALVDGSVSHWSLNLHLGEVIEIGGGSNVAESRLFFTLAGHRSFQGGELRLASEPWLQFGSSDWRKQVLFVPPGNPQLHGTPLQFLRRVSSFRTQTNNELSVQENFSAMIDRISDSLFQWGLDLDCLGTDWKDLSDEEGYLVLLASALASQPKVLLIQDLEVLSSAARDGVDRSILQFAQERGGSVLLMPAENQESS